MNLEKNQLRDLRLMLLLGDTARAGKLISKMGLQAILKRKFVSEC